jgi:glycosyltransferase involved in cell wall biosynthesis
MIDAQRSSPEMAGGRPAPLRTAPPLLLHILPGFGPGGAQARIIALVNGMGPRFRHVIVALNGDLSAADRIEASVDLQCISLDAGANPARAVWRLAAFLRRQRPDLLLTYNWGSIEAVIAAQLSRACPIIHTEDGFGDDEATRQKTRRVLARRLFLRRIYRVIAPSRNLYRIMLDKWRLPPANVAYIPNGVDTEFFRPDEAGKSFGGELVIGTAGRLRPEKKQDELIALCAKLQRSVPVRLRIAGDGPERGRLEQCVRLSELENRVEFLGQVRDLRNFYHGLDLFALTSSTEQMPISVLEAMASGLCVISTDVGDVKQMVSAENAPFIVPAGAGLEEALRTLASDAARRGAIAARNRTRCVESFSLAGMLETYGNLYEQAIG